MQGWIHWGGGGEHPPLGFKPKWGGGGGGGGVDNNPKNEVKKIEIFPQNEYKNQIFAPAASNFSESGSNNKYVAKLGENLCSWENKVYPIPNTSIYWSVEHICESNYILVRTLLERAISHACASA